MGYPVCIRFRGIVEHNCDEFLTPEIYPLNFYSCTNPKMTIWGFVSAYFPNGYISGVRNPSQLCSTIPLKRMQTG